MKRLNKVVVCIFILLMCFAGIQASSIRTFASDLFISEYIEGSGSNDKGLEIFNGTDHTINLNTYRLIIYLNGATSTSGTLVLGSVNLLSGNCYTMVNTGAVLALRNLASLLSNNTVLSFTGNDAIVLQKTLNGTDYMNVDFFGKVGSNPGSAWVATNGNTTINKTLIRRPNVYEGITANPPGSGLTAFATLGTEWDMYPIDTFDYFGTHYFTPGVPPADAPVVLPAAGIKLDPIYVKMTTATPGAQIHYTIDGTDPTESSALYTDSIYVDGTTNFRARAYASGYSFSAISFAQFIIPIEVNNIASLRAQPTGTDVYRLIGESIITFKQGYRNQKYIQDATAAIMIDDPNLANLSNGYITTQYSVGDGVIGFMGRLNEVEGMLQLTPIADPGAPSHTGLTITPPTITTETLVNNFEDYEAQLVKLENVTFTNLGDPPYIFQGHTNYDLFDGSYYYSIYHASFFEVDYIGTAIPLYPVNIVGVLNSNAEGNFITARNRADITYFGTPPPDVKISMRTNGIHLSWDSIPGITRYRIETSNSPYEGFAPIFGTPLITGTSWSATNMGDYKFYRVIAQD